MAKKISQETFDAVVKENQEDFDMPLEEAVQEAVAQFESQGVDLSGIITTAAGRNADGTVQHPVLEHLDALRAQLGDSLDPAATSPILETLSEDLQNKANRTLAAAKGAAEVLLETVEIAAAKDSLHPLLHSALHALAMLLRGQPDLIGPPLPSKEEVASMTMEEEAHKVMGAEEIPPTKAISTIMLATKVKADDARVQHAALLCARFGCIKHERNRQMFVKAGLIEMALAATERFPLDGKVVAEAAQALRTLTLDDDIRVSFGKAHERTKQVADEHDALGRLLRLLPGMKDDATASAEVFKALGQLAVRNEFCKKIVDDGGLDFVLPAMQAHPKDKTVAFAGCSMLRAVAGNDDVKNTIRTSGGIAQLQTTMQDHINDPQVLEQAFGALTAIALRNPENAKTMAVEGAPHVIVKAMQMHPTEAKMQKQACFAIRNMVVRTPELRPLVLGEGAEELIHAAMRTHPKLCGDAGKSALRDLGCKVELKELWTGSVENPKRLQAD